MAKLLSETTYKAEWRGVDKYELETFCRKKSVTGRDFVVLESSETVSLNAVRERVKTAKAVYDRMRAILAALKAAKPKSTKKGRK